MAIGKSAMASPNYKASISVSADVDVAYAAITHGIEHWWTKPDTPIGRLGDRAKFTFPPGRSYWTFEAIELTPPNQVKLKCVDALHLHEGQPEEIEQEWLGTVTQWHISKEGAGSRIDLEHHGLKPELLCFDICKAGWDFFFLVSLKAYLDTGTGRPHLTS